MVVPLGVVATAPVQQDRSHHPPLLPAQQVAVQVFPNAPFHYVCAGQLWVVKNELRHAHACRPHDGDRVSTVGTGHFVQKSKIIFGHPIAGNTLVIVLVKQLGKRTHGWCGGGGGGAAVAAVAAGTAGTAVAAGTARAARAARAVDVADAATDVAGTVAAVKAVDAGQTAHPVQAVDRCH